jgi:hypothetical protein
MVNADPAKELQNVLPKCNPFAIHLLYDFICAPALFPPLLLWVISRVSLRTLLMWVRVGVRHRTLTLAAHFVAATLNPIEVIIFALNRLQRKINWACKAGLS